MNALTLVFASLCIFAIGYRFYGLFIAKKVLGLRVDRPTPAETCANDRDYVKTDKFVLFGHHFAAIAAAGPLLGPVLASQFGYLPGTLWILIGCVLGGAVHDMVVLFASVRHKGQSLAKIAEKEVGKVVGNVASFAFLFILILTLAGLSIACINALFESYWGVLVVGSTIPIAILMGFWMHTICPGDIRGASIIGVALLAAAVIGGGAIDPHSALAAALKFSKTQMAIALPLYAFTASILPVWMLLAPRDYLSTFLKIATIAMLAVGILFIHPNLKMPAFSQFIGGNGPVIPGSVFPFVFITIACGAISGFHAVIATGTTPKMVSSEMDIPFVGYGAMLTEGFVAIMALISACVLIPVDYFAINSAPEAFAKLGMHTVDLNRLEAEVQEIVRNRPGGAVSLAVGMAYIFDSIPGFKGLMKYWYHFVIMFEAVFIMTAIDAGTRVGRFMLQEMFGKVYHRFSEEKWAPGVIITGGLFSLAWGYLVYTGDIATIWPLFGMSNQLLAASALIIVTTMLIRMGKVRYMWVTAVPGIFLSFVTMYAGYLNILSYIPKNLYLLAALSVIIMVMMLIVMVGCFKHWHEFLRVKERVCDIWGDMVISPIEDEECSGAAESRNIPPIKSAAGKRG